MNKVILEIKISRTAQHRWKQAKNFLKDHHRHNFLITAWFTVGGLDRELEFFDLQNMLAKIAKYSIPDVSDKSCEQMATDILEELRKLEYPAIKVSVSEDGENAAIVERVSVGKKIIVLISALSFTGKSTVASTVTQFLSGAVMLEVSKMAKGTSRESKAAQSTTIANNLVKAISEQLHSSAIKVIVVSGLREASIYEQLRKKFANVKFLSYWLHCDDRERSARALISHTKKCIKSDKDIALETYIQEANKVDSVLKVTKLEGLYDETIDITNTTPVQSSLLILRRVEQALREE